MLIECKFLYLVKCVNRTDNNKCICLNSCNGFKGVCPFYKKERYLANEERKERKEK